MCSPTPRLCARQTDGDRRQRNVSREPHTHTGRQRMTAAGRENRALCAGAGTLTHTNRAGVHASWSRVMPPVNPAPSYESATLQPPQPQRARIICTAPASTNMSPGRPSGCDTTHRSPQTRRHFGQHGSAICLPYTPGDTSPDECERSDVPGSARYCCAGSGHTAASMHQPVGAERHAARSLPSGRVTRSACPTGWQESSRIRPANNSDSCRPSSRTA